ncbi:MAG: PilT/PilU family type 4a pilus ATPase [Oscillospiraceae bacterium]|jgi:twitching motility protein PilT|nr:PilT/PilU family type 4a pilus ATPase [Oscillospiraceae bacterium]
MEVLDLLKDAVSRDASDLFLIAGLPVIFKINGQMVRVGEEKQTSSSIAQRIHGVYMLAGDRDLAKTAETGDDDFSFALPGISRFRVNVYRQRGTLAAVIRIITFDLPEPDSIGIPETVMRLSDNTKGLVLVTGTAGSGKSTTLACMIDRINRQRASHIITLEDPIEYLHRHNKSIVSQREIPTDTESYVKALRASLRQSPDVILLGEMRDHETINVAMTAAETGHLILSTLHTVGAAQTIDRVVDAFPANQQNQVRIQLSLVLQGVVSQQLIPALDGTLVPAFEIMLANTAIRNMIRESKIHQIDTVIHSSSRDGMLTMDASLIDLCRRGIISDKIAVGYSPAPELFEKKLKQG